MKKLLWKDINDGVLTTRIIQAKTGKPVMITLHPIAESILEKKKRNVQVVSNKEDRIYTLPSADGANKVLNQWMQQASISKHITWSCARLSFSILLQDRNVDDATIAYLMGHTTTEQVRKTYKRHRPKDQQETMKHLPTPEHLPYFLNI